MDGREANIGGNQRGARVQSEDDPPIGFLSRPREVAHELSRDSLW